MAKTSSPITLVADYRRWDGAVFRITVVLKDGADEKVTAWGKDWVGRFSKSGRHFEVGDFLFGDQTLCRSIFIELVKEPVDE